MAKYNVNAHVVASGVEAGSQEEAVSRFIEIYTALIVIDASARKVKSRKAVK